MGRLIWFSHQWRSDEEKAFARARVGDTSLGCLRSSRFAVNEANDLVSAERLGGR